MKLSRRQLWFGAIALLTLVGLTLFVAPDNKLNSGSTFSRAPEGYGAWYAAMQKQGLPIQRWQKPLSQLPGYGGPAEPAANPITLLQINSQLESADRINETWVAQGHTLVILGIQAPVTAANYSSTLLHEVGRIQIATRRRASLGKGQTLVLGDREGAIIWQRSVGRGQIILATTPHLAANAYQDWQGNYKLLAQLVSQKGQPIWVDEYMHGYRDQETLTQEGTQTELAYFIQTPLFPLLLQVGVLVLVLIWSQNRRFGATMALTQPTIDNSTAYIQALASVLRKAESGEFVQEVIAQAERQQVQQALGLGTVPLSSDELLEAWVTQTGRPAAELQAILMAPVEKTLQPKRPVKDQDLLTWIEQIRTIHQHLPPSKSFP